jgi:pimeloyl-ACP methyl ester carboxylesterase
MTDHFCEESGNDCNNLIFNSIKNYGPPNCCYRLWGPCDPVSHGPNPVQGQPNTILVHGASIRLANGVPQLGHMKDQQNNCFCTLGPLLREDLNGQHNIWEFEYADWHPLDSELCYNFGDLTQYGNRLKEAIGIVKSTNRGAPTNIIAHSMGGLVARYAAQDYNTVGPINKIVTLDTGHFGFDLAGLIHVFLPYIPIGQLQNITCVQQTAPNSPFLKALNSNVQHLPFSLLSIGAGAQLLGIIVVSRTSSDLPVHQMLDDYNHLTIIEIYNESHKAFGPIRDFLR